MISIFRLTCKDLHRSIFISLSRLGYVRIHIFAIGVMILLSTISIAPLISTDAEAGIPRTLYGSCMAVGALTGGFDATFYSGVTSPHLKNYDLIQAYHDEPVGRWTRWRTSDFSAYSTTTSRNTGTLFNATANYFGEYGTVVPPENADIQRVWLVVYASGGYFLPESGWLSFRVKNASETFYTNPDDYPNEYAFAQNNVADDGAGHKYWSMDLNQNNTAPTLFNLTYDTASWMVDGSGNIDQYGWTVTNLLNWSVPMFMNLELAWNQGSSTSYKRIDYIGLSFDFLYYDGSGSTSTDVDLGDNSQIAAVLLLFVFFLPIIVFSLFIPHVGFVIGIAVIGSIFGLLYSGFFSVTIICYFGAGALLINRG